MSWMGQNSKISSISISSSNNITLLRHVAALFVLISHSYGLLNQNEYEPLYILTHYTTLSQVGLAIFFFLSGFLVTGSIIATNNIKHFLIKRILRIYPALIVLILVTVFFIGPIFTKHTFHNYYSAKETWQYLIGGVTLIRIRFFLPGVFNEHGVNGSLWSLPVEFRLYLLLAIAFVLGGLRRKLRYTIIILVAIISYVLISNLNQALISPVFTPYLGWGTYFFLGSAAFINKERIILKKRYLFALLIIWICTINFQILHTFINLLLGGYLTLFLSFKFPAIFEMYFKKNDFSYSLYIYSFLVQQSLIKLFSPHLTPILLIIMTLIVLIPFCYLSWNYIEKPSLALKKRFS